MIMIKYQSDFLIVYALCVYELINSLLHSSAMSVLRNVMIVFPDCSLADVGFVIL